MKIKSATLNGYTTEELKKANIAVTVYAGITIVGRFIGSLEAMINEKYHLQALRMYVPWSNDLISILLAEITSIEVLD